MISNKIFKSEIKGINYDIDGYIYSLDSLFEYYIQCIQDIPDSLKKINIDSILSHVLNNHKDKIEYVYAFIIQKILTLIKENSIEIIVDDLYLSELLNIKYYSHRKYVHFIKNPKSYKIKNLNQFYHYYFKIQYEDCEIVEMLVIFGIKS